MSNDKQFSGKVALVTGAARGIGAATAKAFAEAGAKVMLADLLDDVEATAQAIVDAGGIAMAVTGDVSKPEDCQNIVQQTVASFGQLDFAFNNAGIGGDPVAIHDMPIDNWQRMININLNSVFYCSKYELEAMLKTGGGVIVNSSSFCGQRPLPGQAHYVATKHAVLGLTRNTALEYGAHGIRCVAVGPGYIKTAMTEESFDEDTEAAYITRIPAGRAGLPEDVATVVKMLCSEDAVYVNGAYLSIDGGLLLS